MPRTDLLELGPDALTALANPGFVKRAQKDVATGALPALRQDPDGTVHALFDDGTQTSMGPNAALRDAECSCSAGGMCRHRVMLVLAYQAGAAAAPVADQAPDEPAAGWSPARFDDAAIAAAVASQAIEQARKLALERPVVTVVLAAVPAAYLPMSQVRFFSSTSLALARCDCRQGSGCAHVVLAAWAFRQAAQSHPGVDEVTLEVSPSGAAAVGAPGGLMTTEAALQVREQVRDWLWSLWREGASQPLLGLEARHEALQTALSDLGWTWVREELDTVWDILRALARRSNRYGMDDLVHACARLYLRLEGAAHADATPGARLPASQILGIGQQGEVALDLLRLVSLGMTCWRDDVDEGARIVFADPDTQAACVLERTWPRDADDADASARLLNRRIAGLPLRQLAAGQVVTRAAKRRANGKVELGAQARQTSALALSPRAWDDLRAPLRFDSLRALLEHLRGRPPAGIRPGEAARNWHVVGVGGLALEEWAWDGARQVLTAAWRDGDGLGLRASLPYSSLSPGAVDAFARALEGEWGAVLALAGPVWREGGRVAVRPASVLTERRAIVLAVEPKAPHPMRLRDTPQAVCAGEALLRESFDLLGQVLRQGSRHMVPALRTRLVDQALRLDEAGYPQAGRLMREACSVQRDGAGLRVLCGMGLLLGEAMNQGQPGE